jgi:PBSX family phage terminase large subunit
MRYNEYPKDDGLICAPTYKILSQSTLPKFFQLNPDLRVFYKESKGTIEVPNRGIIYIRSTENPNVIEGMTLRWIWADEAGQMKLQAWINIQGRISILKGNVFLSTTPYSINWLRTDFYEQWKKGNKDYDVIQFRSVDNPYFPQEEFDRVKDTMDRRTFERRYCGLFTKMEGLVYEDFNYSFNVTDKIPNSFDVVLAGIDWGFKAPTAIIILGIKDNVIYIIDEFYESNKITSELSAIAKAFLDKYPISTFYADSAEQDRIEEFRREGFVIRDSNKDIDFGVGIIQGLIKEKRFYVHPRCKFFLEEIEIYHYPEFKENKEIKEKPVKVDDHAMDATRYPLASFFTKTKISFARLDGDKMPYEQTVEPLKPIVVGEVKQLTPEEKREQIRQLDRELIKASEKERIERDY